MDKQTLHDQQKIENLKTEDEVLFSTVTINIYQNPVTVKNVIADNYKENKPSFLIRVVQAFKGGIETLGDLFVLIVRIWLLILFAVVVFIIIRKCKN